MSSLLGMPTEADTDMISGYDFDFGEPMAADTMAHDDFDIDLTFEDHAEQLDEDMVDGEEHHDLLEADMADNDTLPDEQMIEHHEEPTTFEVEIEDLDVPTPKAGPLEPVEQLTAAEEFNVELPQAEHTLDVEPNNDDATFDAGHATAEDQAVSQEDSNGETLDTREAEPETITDEYHPDGDDQEAVNDINHKEDFEGEADTNDIDEHNNLLEFNQEQGHQESAGNETTTHLSPPNQDQTANQETGASQIEENADTSSFFKYLAVVQWQTYSVPLFPAVSMPSGCFTEDVSLAEKSLNAFFDTGRQVLSDHIGDDHLLEINVPQLDLSIDEVSVSLLK
jgi:hypothetical protein